MIMEKVPLTTMQYLRSSPYFNAVPLGCLENKAVIWKHRPKLNARLFCPKFDGRSLSAASRHLDIIIIIIRACTQPHLRHPTKKGRAAPLRARKSAGTNKKRARCKEKNVSSLPPSPPQPYEYL
jgi:hypothetical protein